LARYPALLPPPRHTYLKERAIDCCCFRSFVHLQFKDQQGSRVAAATEGCTGRHSEQTPRMGSVDCGLCDWSRTPPRANQPAMQSTESLAVQWWCCGETAARVTSDTVSLTHV
jgi:hypothetical protein